MSDWIADARAFYQRRPWVEDAMAEDQDANRCVEVDVLERRWRVRLLLRDLIRAAKTPEAREEVIELVALAHLAGDLTRKQAITAKRWMDRHR